MVNVDFVLRIDPETIAAIGWADGAEAPEVSATRNGQAAQVVFVQPHRRLDLKDNVATGFFALLRGAPMAPHDDVPAPIEAPECEENTALSGAEAADPEMVAPLQGLAEPEAYERGELLTVAPGQAAGAAVARLPEPDPRPPLNDPIALRVSGTVVEVNERRLTADWHDFLTGAVDEALLEYVLMTIDGALPEPQGEQRETLFARLRNDSTRLVEDRTLACAMDAVYYNPALGFGVGSGWMLKANEIDTRIVGLALCSDRLRRIDVFENSRVHHGLEGFPDQLEKTGMDGYFTVFAHDAGDPQPEKVLLIIRSDGRARFLGRMVQHQARGTFIRSLVNSGIYKAHEDLISGLIEANARADVVPKPDLTAIDETPVEAASVGLLLDHDAADEDIREVLRIARERLARPIVYQPNVIKRTPGFRQGLRAATLDAPASAFKLLPPTSHVELPVLAEDCDVVVFASSSALVQLHGVKACLEAVEAGAAAAVTVFAPLAREAEGAAQREAIWSALVQADTPFFLAVRTEPLAQCLSKTTAHLLGTMAQFRAVALLLAQAGAKVSIELDSARHCFGGHSTLVTRSGSRTALASLQHDELVLRVLLASEIPA